MPCKLILDFLLQVSSHAVPVLGLFHHLGFFSLLHIGSPPYCPVGTLLLSLSFAWASLEKICPTTGIWVGNVEGNMEGSHDLRKNLLSDRKGI